MSHDVAIVGSGFAGSILARVLRSRGMRVLLLERGRHPRFALGESSTPLAGLALERLAARSGLRDLHHLSTHGRWSRHLPELRRGLKRGFTFYRHHPGEAFRNSAENEARLLVAASPDDEIADCHWLRADVDHHLVRRAVAEGVDYVDQIELDGVEFGSEGIELQGVQGGGRRSFRASYLIDASGPGGFLARHLPIATRKVTIESRLIFTHVAGLGSFEELARAGGAVLDPGPYPDERAAIHHVLDEGWLYVLPFDHGTSSVGLLLRREGTWDEVLGRYPTLQAQFAGAKLLRPLESVPRIQHRLERVAGERWVLLPHAYAFFDPLFSTGMAWSLLAVERLADVLEGRGGDFEAYGELIAEEADQVERLITAAYRAMPRFDFLTSVSFLYFAAVSFAETRQRLLEVPEGGAPWAWDGFLGARDPLLRDLFAETLERLAEAETVDSAEFGRRVAEAIAPRDVAGLADPARCNLYPVDLDVLIDRARLLGLEREDVRRALPRLRGYSP